MRRNEREIRDMQDIVSVIEGCQEIGRAHV